MTTTCPACNGAYGHWTRLCDEHLTHYIRYFGLTPDKEQT